MPEARRDHAGSRIYWHLAHRTRLSRPRVAKRSIDTHSGRDTPIKHDPLGSAVASGRRQIDVSSETRGGPRPHAHIATVSTRISIDSPANSETADRLGTTSAGTTATGTCRGR